jgi:hypothetical protein
LHRNDAAASITDLVLIPLQSTIELGCVKQGAELKAAIDRSVIENNDTGKLPFDQILSVGIGQ